MIFLFDLWSGAVDVVGIVGALVSVLAGVMLFRVARSVQAESGQRAMVDVFAAVFGVGIFTLFSLTTGQRCGPVLFLTLCALIGILSAAAFRRIPL